MFGVRLFLALFYSVGHRQKCCGVLANEFLPQVLASYQRFASCVS